MRYIKGLVSKDAEMKYDKELNDYVMVFSLVNIKHRKPTFYTVEFVGRTSKRMVYYITKGRPLRVLGRVCAPNIEGQPYSKVYASEIKFIQHI